MSKSSSPQNQIYQLKIALQEIEPLCWRRLLVRSDTKFPLALHLAAVGALPRSSRVAVVRHTFEDAMR